MLPRRLLQTKPMHSACYTETEQSRMSTQTHSTTASDEPPTSWHQHQQGIFATDNQTAAAHVAGPRSLATVSADEQEVAQDQGGPLHNLQRSVRADSGLTEKASNQQPAGLPTSMGSLQPPLPNHSDEQAHEQQKADHFSAGKSLARDRGGILLAAQRPRMAGPLHHNRKPATEPHTGEHIEASATSQQSGDAHVQGLPRLHSSPTVNQHNKEQLGDLGNTRTTTSLAETAQEESKDTALDDGESSPSPQLPPILSLFPNIPNANIGVENTAGVASRASLDNPTAKGTTLETSSMSQQQEAEPHNVQRIQHPYQPALDALLSLNTDAAQPGLPKPKRSAGRRCPATYDDDVPIKRKGAHKGRVCAASGCEKFARLSADGERRYCIVHMREMGIVPKAYNKGPLHTANSTGSESEDDRPAQYARSNLGPQTARPLQQLLQDPGLKDSLLHSLGEQVLSAILKPQGTGGTVLSGSREYGANLVASADSDRLADAVGSGGQLASRLELTQRPGTGKVAAVTGASSASVNPSLPPPPPPNMGRLLLQLPDGSILTALPPEPLPLLLQLLQQVVIPQPPDAALASGTPAAATAATAAAAVLTSPLQAYTRAVAAEDPAGMHCGRAGRSVDTLAGTKRQHADVDKEHRRGQAQTDMQAAAHVLKLTSADARQLQADFLAHARGNSNDRNPTAKRQHTGVPSRPSSADTDRGVHGPRVLQLSMPEANQLQTDTQHANKQQPNPASHHVSKLQLYDFMAAAPYRPTTMISSKSSSPAEQAHPMQRSTSQAQAKGARSLLPDGNDQKMLHRDSGLQLTLSNPSSRDSRGKVAGDQNPASVHPGSDSMKDAKLKAAVAMQPRTLPQKETYVSVSSSLPLAASSGLSLGAHKSSKVDGDINREREAAKGQEIGADNKARVLEGSRARQLQPQPAGSYSLQLQKASKTHKDRESTRPPLPPQHASSDRPAAAQHSSPDGVSQHQPLMLLPSSGRLFDRANVSNAAAPQGQHAVVQFESMANGLLQQMSGMGTAAAQQQQSQLQLVHTRGQSGYGSDALLQLLQHGRPVVLPAPAATTTTQDLIQSLTSHSQSHLLQAQLQQLQAQSDMHGALSPAVRLVAPSSVSQDAAPMPSMLQGLPLVQIVPANGGLALASHSQGLSNMTRAAASLPVDAQGQLQLGPEAASLMLVVGEDGQLYLKKQDS